MNPGRRPPALPATTASGLSTNPVGGRAGQPSSADADLLAQVINRASSPRFEEWWGQLSDSGFCAAPVHLTRRDDRQTVEVMARCKNRRASVCPSCSHLYAGDTWHLVHSGIAGDGRDIPPTLGNHPMVFATLTAPGFGKVHSTGRDTANAQACQSGQPDRLCPHGRATSCAIGHGLADPAVGQPLCADCYDYVGHVLFTWFAPQLWHRFTVHLRRLVRQHCRKISEEAVRVSYVKVVEMQRRLIPHFHAVIRLDAATRPAEPIKAPDTAIDALDLASLVHRAASATRLQVTGPQEAAVRLRFGTQIDIRSFVVLPPPTAVTAGHGATVAPELAGRRVAAYLAKYVTKSVVDIGLSARRLHGGMIDDLDVTGHIRQILYTICDLARLPDHRDLSGWLHTLGFRGHTTTKTRRYSTTMGELRARRNAWQRQQATPRDPGPGRGPSGDDTDAGKPATDWQYIACGLDNDGERLLAISAAHRLSDMRRVAREETADADG